MGNAPQTRQQFQVLSRRRKENHRRRHLMLRASPRMVMNSGDASRAGRSIPVMQNWVRRHKNADLLQRTEEKRKERKMMKSMNHTLLVMVTANAFPPILSPHLSSVLERRMIKSRFIDCVTWKNLQSFSKLKQILVSRRKEGCVGISKRVCYACTNPSG